MLPESRAWRFLAAASIAVLALIAYGNTVDGDWVWDDASSVLLHETVQQPGRFFALFGEDQHAYGRGQGNFYRPLVAATFMVDYVLSGGDAFVRAPGEPYPPIPTFYFHLSNILWHGAAAILLLLVLLRLGAGLPVAWAVAALYVIHPLHTEAVAYISGRADMMSGVFMYLGLLCALAAVTSARPWLGWTGCVAAFALGMLSKESTAMFPFLLALVVALRPRVPGEAEDIARQRLNRWVPVGACAAVLILYGVLRTTVLSFGEGGGDEASPFLVRLVETGQAFSFYLWKLFVPTGLHMEQTLAGVPAWTAVPGYLALALIACAAVLAFRQGHWRITAGLGWFLLTWFPISGIFPLNAPMAEHWMYVPMAGFWWALAEGCVLLMKRLPPLRIAVPAATAALALLLLGLTVQRNDEWHSNESLFRATLRENPDTMRVQYNLAVTYEDLEGNRAGARRHFHEVLRLQGVDLADTARRQVREDEIDVRLSLGQLAFDMGHFEEAAEHFRIVASLPAQGRETETAVACLGAGKAMLALGETGLSEQYFFRAVELLPEAQGEVERIMEGAPLL